MITQFALSGIERALNACLNLDPEIASRIAALEGESFLIEITPFQISCFVIVQQQRFVLHANAPCAATASVTLRGTPISLLRLAYGEDRVLQQQAVQIEGSIEVAQRLQTVLSTIEIDWEELVARYCGDVIAHQVGTVFRTLTMWFSDNVSNMKNNVTEYLQDEIRQLPAPFEVADFCATVDVVRDDCERLIARVDRLAKIERHST